MQSLNPHSSSLLAPPAISVPLGTMTDSPISPVPWQTVDQLMPYMGQSPGSDAYLTVNQFAQKVFDGDDYASLAYQTAPPSDLPGSLSPHRSPPITDSMAHLSPPVTSPFAQKELPADLMPTSDSNIEPQIQALAAEIYMSSTLMSRCVGQYFRYLYPIMPVIHEATFRQKLNSREELSPADKCLVVSMCAITVLHASPPSELALEAKKNLGRQFLLQFLDMRRALSPEWVESATLSTIIASYFASVSYFELKKPRTSNFYVREATGMALEQGLHLDSFYLGMDRVSEICHRRTFALLFVTERGASILRDKPILISKLASLPTEYFEDEDPSILTGFQCLCRLFALLDEKFIEVWRSSESQTDRRPSLGELSEIQENLANLSFESADLPDIQRADVEITQQWLRLIFWQASMRQGIVSSKSENAAFTYQYPLMIAKALCGQMSDMTVNALAVHGLGIFEKVFEVAYTLMDALTIAKKPWSESEELRYLFSCLSSSPNSHSTYVRMLETKLEGQKLTLHSLSKGGKVLQSPELAEQREERQRQRQSRKRPRLATDSPSGQPDAY